MRMAALGSPQEPAAWGSTTHPEPEGRTVRHLQPVESVCACASPSDQPTGFRPSRPARSGGPDNEPQREDNPMTLLLALVPIPVSSTRRLACLVGR